VTTYDGGKAMVGYGKFDNTTHYGWVLKMFGTMGTNVYCAASIKPAGYQTMVSTTVWASRAPAVNCATHTQWTVI